MCGKGIKRGDVVKPQLSQGRLEHFDPGRRVCGFGGYWIGHGVRCGGVNGLDDLVDLRRNKRICHMVRHGPGNCKMIAYLAAQASTVSARLPRPGSRTSRARL